MKARTFFLLPLLLVFAASCKFPEIKQLQLKRPFMEFQPELGNPGGFEHVTLTTNSNSWNGVTENSISIELLNGKAIPVNGDSLQAFVKSKARLVANEIINKNDYASITIVLKTESKSGLVTKSTKRSFSFSFAELEEDISQVDSVKADSIMKDSLHINTTEL